MTPRPCAPVTVTAPRRAANRSPDGTVIATVFSAGARLPLATVSDSVGRPAPTPVSETRETLGNPITVHLNTTWRSGAPW